MKTGIIAPWALVLFLGFFAGSAHSAPVLLFPGLEHAAPGAARCTMVLSNPTVTSQSILLEMLPPGAAIASAARTVLLAPGEKREIADLSAFLGTDGAGMLRVTGEVEAKIRSHREDDDSILQEVPEVHSQRPIAPNEDVEFPYTTPADIERDARSNLILVNLDTKDVTVTISEGSITALKTIPAGASVEIDNLGGYLGTPPGIRFAHAVGDGAWFGSMKTIRTLDVGQRHRAVTPPGRLPSSFGLIDAALAAGTITAEQALTYKVFSDFGDPRLPAAFMGDDSEVTEADSPGLAATQWATLSPATQDLIGPYFMPAFYEGSWWYLRRAAAQSIRPAEVGCKAFDTFALCKIGKEWSYVAGAHIRVWFDVAEADDMTDGEDLVKETDEKIWPELIKVMGREPLLADEIGGTKLLDAVLTDNLKPGALATTYPLGSGCLLGPTYVAVQRNLANIPYRNSAFAHELFHSVQHAYNTNGGGLLGCLEYNYKWLMESTATWFEDELYPAVNREQVFAQKYLDHTDLSIDTTVGLDDEGITGHRYGAYVFFFYLTRIAGANPYTLVRNVWEATEWEKDAIHALDTGLKNQSPALTLDKVWPDFAAYSWNRAAPYNAYQTIQSGGAPEGLTKRAKIETRANFSVPSGDGKGELGGKQLSLPHLSMQYFWFDFPDDTASTVVFYNGIQRALNTKSIQDFAGNVLTAEAVSDPNSIKGAHVDVLVKITGQDQWKHEDLTDQPFKSYCRDLTAERIESMVIILSNSDISNTLQPQGKYAPILQATNIGCYAWEGSADLSYHESESVFDKLTVSNLRLEAVGDVPDDDSTPLRRRFDLVGGTYTWSVSGVSADCSYQGQVVGESVGTGNLFTFPYAIRPAAGARGINAGLFSALLQQRNIVTESCSDGPKQINWGAVHFFLEELPDMPEAQLSADGRTYTLDVSTIDPDLAGTWKLTAKKQ